jgi:hypothetical protein
MILINNDANCYEFQKNEKYYIDATSVVVLTLKQWKILVDICDEHNNDKINNNNRDDKDTTGKKKENFKKEKKRK